MEKGRVSYIARDLQSRNTYRLRHTFLESTPEVLKYLGLFEGV